MLIMLIGVVVLLFCLLQINQEAIQHDVEQAQARQIEDWKRCCSVNYSKVDKFEELLRPSTQYGDVLKQGYWFTAEGSKASVQVYNMPSEVFKAFQAEYEKAGFGSKPPLYKITVERAQ